VAVCQLGPLPAAAPAAADLESTYGGVGLPQLDALEARELSILLQRQLLVRASNKEAEKQAQHYKRNPTLRRRPAACVAINFELNRSNGGEGMAVDGNSSGTAQSREGLGEGEVGEEGECNETEAEVGGEGENCGDDGGEDDNDEASWSCGICGQEDAPELPTVECRRCFERVLKQETVYDY